MKIYRVDKVSVAMIGGFVEELEVYAKDKNQMWEALANYINEDRDECDHVTANDCRTDGEQFHILNVDEEGIDEVEPCVDFICSYEV